MSAADDRCYVLYLCPMQSCVDHILSADPGSSRFAHESEGVITTYKSLKDFSQRFGANHIWTNDPGGAPRARTKLDQLIFQGANPTEELPCGVYGCLVRFSGPEERLRHWALAHQLPVLVSNKW